MVGVGTQIEKYVVEAELGGGGMAKVYKVRHGLLGSLHALKVLNPDLVRDDELRSRFLAEGQIQARLRHPNIVAVTDIVAVPGVAGLVMDYIEGPTLEDFVTKLGTPPSTEIVRDIFKQVLAGVGHAHLNGVIHRDLKPANVLLEAKGPNRYHARILDFGIAKVKEGDGTSKRATRAGARMGTPHYMSPEQIRHSRDVNARSDIFSLGATLYEFATGKMAFDGGSDYEIEHKIVEGKFEPPNKLHPGIDAKVSAAIVKALSPDPANRFGSCEEFASALGGSSSSTTSTTIKPITVPGKSPPIVPIAIGAIVLLAAVGGAVFALRSDTPVTPVVVAPDEKPPEVVKVDTKPPEVVKVDTKPPEVVKEPEPVKEPPKAEAAPPSGMVAIAGASFTMGRAPYGVASAIDVPAHEVTVARFAMQKGEVTLGEFKEFVDATNAESRMGGFRYFPRFAAMPVINVAYEFAAEYCRWKFPKGRLPTEAEWELAARGTAGRLYPWGNEWSGECVNGLKGERGILTTADGNACGATPEGLVHLVGNAWEWTSSEPQAYPGGTARLPPAGFHVIRGGSFFNTNKDELTATVRRFVNAPNAYLGFRCAADL